MAETATAGKTTAGKTEKVAQPVKAKPYGVQAPVGCPIHWFQNGRANEEPWAAKCLGHVGPDMIALRAWDPEGVREVNITSCPHMSDPLLVTRPSMPGLDPEGAWDYIQDLPALIPEKHRGIDAKAVRIVLLNLKHYYSPQQISDAMRLPLEVVETVLKKNAGKVPFEE